MAPIKSFQFLLIPLMTILFLSSSFAQSNADDEISYSIRKNEEEHLKGTHRFTLGLGHTLISGARDENGKQRAPLASWSFDYDYWLSNEWAIGIQNEYILENFIVEHNESPMIERNRPIAVGIVGMHKLSRHWTLVAGTGSEFSEGSSLWFTRLGVEYGVPLPKAWEAGVSLFWDNKWNYYNSWGISAVFSKLYQKRQRD